MNTILPEILSLLSSEAGGLIYQLVLAFSIAGALLGAILYARAFDAKLGYRMAAGLGGLLLLRLALFAASGLTWQGLANPGMWLALVDRGIAILSLILIIWLWVFPAPSRIGDSATLILALLSISLLTLAGIWRSQQAVNLPLSETFASRFNRYLFLRADRPWIYPSLDPAAAWVGLRRGYAGWPRYRLFA